MLDKMRDYRTWKRGIDIVGATAGLVIAAPVMLGVSIAIRKNLGSPVIFKQERPGKDGKIFTMYKFRTMKEVDHNSGLVENGDRLTDFGRKLRSTSLDELPSLLNVLRGDMSLVGPRPLLVEYLDLYTPEQARRHDVRPGITGLAQVSGRNELDWEHRFTLDLKYVDSKSLRLDVDIIRKTVLNVVSRTGITSEGYEVGAPFEGNGVKDV